MGLLVRPAGQTNGTDQLGIPAGQTSWTNQLDRPAGWTSWTDQLDRPAWRTSWTDQLNRPAKQTSWTDKPDGPGLQTSWMDQLFLFEALASLHLQRFFFKFVHCRSFRVRQRPCFFLKPSPTDELGIEHKYLWRPSWGMYFCPKPKLVCGSALSFLNFIAWSKFYTFNTKSKRQQIK